MGIQGLFPFVDPVMKNVHIEQYSGKKIAIDGRTWLYRGGFGCAFELCMNLDTNKYVTYFIRMVQSLVMYNIIPIIVFEGQILPLKKEFKIQQLLKKEKYLQQGYFHAENNNIEDAKKYFQQGFSITEQMIRNVIKALDDINVQHVVAPYDVGPQLAYMSKNKQVDSIITEDSELLAFGCDDIIYKLDRKGHGKHIQFENILKKDELKMTHFTKDMFRYMCITAGCDYLSSISVSGIERARELVRNHPTIDKLSKAFKARFSTISTDPYIKGFQQADAAFLYQFVYDIDSRCYDRLNHFPKGLKVASFYLLGQNPQSRYVSILRSNNAIRLPKFESNNNHKKDNTELLKEDESLDKLEFDNNVTIKSVDQATIKPTSFVKPSKSRSPRPILTPKPIRRFSTNSENTLKPPSSRSNTSLDTKSILFSPLVDETKSCESSRSCKFKVQTIDTFELRHTNTHSVNNTRTRKTIQPRPVKRKLNTFDNVLPPNKITKLKEEDPFGLNLL